MQEITNASVSLQNAIVLTVLGVGLGFCIGYVIRILVALSKKNSIELDIKKLFIDAKEKAEKIILTAENKASDTLKEAREQIKEKEEHVQKSEERLSKKEEYLVSKEQDIDHEVSSLKDKVAEIKAIKEKVDAQMRHTEAELERVSGMSKESAITEILQRAEKENEQIITSRIYKLENFAHEKIEDRSREILATSIQRLATSVSSDLFTTQIPIPSEEVKGKIIGKEGRNIKTFERISGVEVIVDDSQGFITISCFDPIRRQIAKIALENLIIDGRIQPARIEYEMQKAEEEIQKVIKKEGERAVYETGVMYLDPKIIQILGRLHFRTSYGQNVLQHSIECAHIAGMIAAEIGANVSVSKAGALLHDIGKALDHEVQGSHVEIGRKILDKFGVSEDIIKAMQAHHEEYPYETIESRIVQTADAISGSRTGARKDNIEQYIKRLEELEEIALREHGVEKAYALQAGRELRVFVNSNTVNDLQAHNMAKNIAKSIEESLKYPGEIKVSVIREMRITEVAR
ncbi:MAG: ribonuclease Y [Candidatus Taylorbacteria bacterium]|nr:ribonuclease Y [Candidatus Taylorbacteria bacterium]